MPRPLENVRVLEFMGMGPVPLCAHLLVGMGADVQQVRPIGGEGPQNDVVNDGRSYVALNLKATVDKERALELVASADILIEGYRPGVMERLGLGPEECHAVNPALVYGRMTGWGQDGPLASVPGHDINYIAVSGALHAIGREGEAPVPPLNLVGDYAGGSMFLLSGVLAALTQARDSKKGLVVDCAMVDGVAAMLSSVYGFLSKQLWRDKRGVNFLDSGAPFYNTYECSDGGYIAVGAIEPQFYDCFMRLTGLSDTCEHKQWDVEYWPEMKRQYAECIATKSRDEWCAILEGTDACVSPVLSMVEATVHPHMKSRQSYSTCESGLIVPAFAPRFSA